MKVVLLHPLPLDGSIWATSTRELGDECVAPTLYGCGDTLDEWARAALDHAGPGPMIVVGCSIGGSCAVEMALLAPGDVRALLLSGTNPGHRPEPDLRDEALRLLGAEGVAAAWRRYWEPLFGPGAGGGIVERAGQVAERCGPSAIACGVRVFHSRRDRRAFLASWDGPVSMVSGAHDIRPARSRAIAASLRDGAYREIEGAGHYVPIEHPPAFDAVIREALDRVAG